jgi:DNA helicase-2/ATP-dependent DNA helicase PcrA
VFEPRPRQREVAAYRGGRMGVSAVPGSGKTSTLSYLAAQIVASGVLEDDQEILIVTLVNSAVDNFSARVSAFVKERGLVPHLGYRVRTLHGLAHDIVRDRPALAGLAEGFQIVDERVSERILREAANAWAAGNSEAVARLLAAEMEEEKQGWVRRTRLGPLVADVARTMIREAKDLLIAPADLRDRLDRLGVPLELAEMGCAIYSDYQRALAYRGAVDFDDLVGLALRVLEANDEYLERLRHRWPFILEDEAQDSSRLQEQTLRLLAGPDGNWVRVGDPNQAIYETFTTASPQFLRDFLCEEEVAVRELPNSGRSTRGIMDLANRLIDWTREEHPVEEVRRALWEPHIAPAPPGDPQPNPQDEPGQIQIVDRKLSPAAEIEFVVGSLEQWLPEHQGETAAVLAPRNDRGEAVAGALRERGLDCIELLRSTMATRAAAGALAHIGRCLADPVSPSRLAKAYRVWRRDDRQDAEAAARVDRVASLLGKCSHVESFLAPRGGADWLASVPGGAEERVQEQLDSFRELMLRWQGASLLPIDQMILTVAMDLFEDQPDLAVAHKLAVVLRGMAESAPDWELPELVRELAVVARNQRRFVGMSGDDTGFDPDQYRGKVVVATVHKAKGLEWDRVYLMSVNNYNYPSGLSHDSYFAEKWFVRGQLNLEAESLAQLRAAVSGADYVEGEATRRARLEYAAERLRLLYVGITRARRELIVTWNTGRRGDSQPAAPFVALQTYWEERTGASAR